MWSYQRDLFQQPSLVKSSFRYTKRQFVEPCITPLFLCGFSFGETFPAQSLFSTHLSFGSVDGYETRLQPRLSSYMGSGFLRSTKTSRFLSRWIRTNKKKSQPRFPQSSFCAINWPMFMCLHSGHDHVLSLFLLCEKYRPCDRSGGIQDENISKLCRVFCLASSSSTSAHLRIYLIYKKKRNWYRNEVLKTKTGFNLTIFCVDLLPSPFARANTIFRVFLIFLRPFASKIPCKLWSRILNESVTRYNGLSRVKQIGK